MAGLTRAPILVSFLGLLFLGTPIVAQTVITPDSLDDWLIGPFGTPPPVDFVQGPDTPPFGTGSYETEIVVASSKIILLRTDYHDLPLADLTALSYWTYVDPVATNTNNWYVNLYVDADGDGSWDERLDFVPPPAMVVQGLWQFWDAHAGTWTTSGGGPTTLADFLLANPNARINAFDPPLGGAIRLNMGDTASSYVGFLGNLDGVRIAVNGVGDETWDFELFGAVEEIPTISSWGVFALIVALLLAGTSTLVARRKEHRATGG